MPPGSPTQPSSLNGIVGSVAATEVLQQLTGFAAASSPNCGWIYDGLTGTIERVAKTYRGLRPDGPVRESLAGLPDHHRRDRISSSLAGTLTGVGALKLPGRGRPKPLLDENGRPLRGSISEKAFADINGVRQGMFIQSKDPAHPVLLFVHGGLPEYFLTERHPTGLENDFTVVWWEQRGAGLSYNPRIPPETMTVEQFIADTLAVTGHLQDRFSKQKIYLMAHSGGTFIGVQAAARTPELYHAYIGVAQTVQQLKSERLAYEYMLGRLKETGNSRLARKLEAAPVSLTDGTPDAYLAVRDEAMHYLGVGTTHDMKSVLSGVIWPSLRSPQYTLSEKIRMGRGKLSSGVSALWDEMLATDLAQTVTELAVPAYFFHGIYDYTVSYQLAKDYVKRLKAPLKGFYTFDRSAHSPILEEPEKARKILREDVLAGTNNLADDPCP